jgi:hypothetical protein
MDMASDESHCMSEPLLVISGLMQSTFYRTNVDDHLFGADKFKMIEGSVVP